MDSQQPPGSKRPDDRPEKEKDGRRRMPHLREWDSVMDELIEDAIRSGAFDDLPGKGKPLKLSKNPFAPEEQLAHQLLKDNNYTLPWIAERRKVHKRIDAFRSEVSRVAQRYRAEYESAASETVRLALSTGWSRQLARWQMTIATLNKQIAEANLKQPAEHLEIYKLTLENELRRAGADSELT
ncbi:MAG: DUF1992 domain-containing protein [Candidatus Promineifilaceae bacterium]|nr:DUF1992 domain-containing protein [Candidatus Promineifilaceae bacterium]